MVNKTCVEKLKFEGKAAQFESSAALYQAQSGGELIFEARLTLNQQLLAEARVDAGSGGSVDELAVLSTLGSAPRVTAGPSLRLSYSDCDALRTKKVYLRLKVTGSPAFKLTVRSLNSCLRHSYIGHNYIGP